ncbi:MAG: acyl-ACP thioesterase, partial [Alistipes sp.]|nr:acyl-ACP thioesterase [Alistipes sp.]
MAQQSRFDFRIDPQEVDFTLRATLPSLVAAILNAAGLDAHNRGFGVDAINAGNRSWVLSRMAVELARRPARYTGYGLLPWCGDYGRVV